MFDFEKLEAYVKAKRFHKDISCFVREHSIAQPEKGQLLRASLSIALNIAEGAGRFTKPDKRNSYVIARGSVYECVAILDILKDARIIDASFHRELYLFAEELSKILYALLCTYSK